MTQTDGKREHGPECQITVAARGWWCIIPPVCSCGLVAYRGASDDKIVIAQLGDDHRGCMAAIAEVRSERDRLRTELVAANAEIVTLRKELAEWPVRYDQSVQHLQERNSAHMERIAELVACLRDRPIVHRTGYYVDVRDYLPWAGTAARLVGGIIFDDEPAAKADEHAPDCNTITRKDNFHGQASTEELGPHYPCSCAPADPKPSAAGRPSDEESQSLSWYLRTVANRPDLAERADRLLAYTKRLEAEHKYCRLFIDSGTAQIFRTTEDVAEQRKRAGAAEKRVAELEMERTEARNEFGMYGFYGQVLMDNVLAALAEVVEARKLQEKARAELQGVLEEAVSNATYSMRNERDQLRAQLTAAADKAGGERRTYEQDLAAVINRFGVDDECDTPDFILARVAMKAVSQVGKSVRAREEWLGRKTTQVRTVIADEAAKGGAT